MTCPRCKGKGKIETLVDGAYYWIRDDSHKWEPAMYRGDDEFDCLGANAVAVEDVEVGPRIFPPEKRK